MQDVDIDSPSIEYPSIHRSELSPFRRNPRFQTLELKMCEWCDANFLRPTGSPLIFCEGCR
jgi:hypothetical protein